jgi:hypothetical protein
VAFIKGTDLVIARNAANSANPTMSEDGATVVTPGKPFVLIGKNVQKFETLNHAQRGINMKKSYKGGRVLLTEAQARAFTAQFESLDSAAEALASGIISIDLSRTNADGASTAQSALADLFDL